MQRVIQAHRHHPVPVPVPVLLAMRGRAVSTFANQDKLPRLPVPDLKATASRYLKSLRPLLSSDEYGRSERAVSSFVGSDGMGPILQQRLLEVERTAPYNWMEDMWLRKAYLEWREPTYINVNWYAVMADNPEMPLVGDAPRGQTTQVQIARAARLVAHLLEANDAVNDQTMPPEMHRGVPLCMNQFQWQFGTTRIPHAGCDRVVNQYPSTAKHILVMYRAQTVAVPVYGAGGQRASLAQIVNQLIQTTKRIDSMMAGKKDRQPSVANLTAGNRDDWAAARELLEKDAANRASLETVDAALFVVCLDVDVDAQDTADVHRTIGVLNHSDAGSNRWYDKSIQLIVLNSGRFGVNCEHTPVDALTTARMLLEMSAKERGPYKDTAPCAELAPPEPIQWTVEPEVARLVHKARGEAGALASNLQILQDDAPEYGAQWIKTIGASPDAFFQIALQAAYYRHHGKPTATYESASLRKFLHGRTETIRSCTAEALAFSRALDDRDVPMAKKLALFQQAVAAHVELSVAAGSGNGVDRHLLGLRTQIRSPEEAERATLFCDPAYAQSATFALSTSNVTPGDRFRGGFAPVVAHGYGISYALDKTDIKFTVTDWRASAVTDAPAFRDTIRRTLADLYEAGEHAKATAPS
ncbi:hypothetical protein EV175_001288 [Coemansia sp. RSA 1933]|nr:hypothetical protein EV175_001288 [Coemansia sp. RSA 1933]